MHNERISLMAHVDCVQVARQQGEYLAKMFMRGKLTGDPATSNLARGQKPFRYNHKGSLAYVGQDKAVMDVPTVGPLFGFAAGVAWKVVWKHIKWITCIFLKVLAVIVNEESHDAGQWRRCVQDLRTSWIVGRRLNRPSWCLIVHNACAMTSKVRLLWGILEIL